MGIARFKTLALAVAVLAVVPVCAIARSFVYIQSDPTLPIYVKLEGKMLPRYGKSYCIIPNLDAGTINIEVLFQQNVHPAQKFTVQVPPSGHRGFYVVKRDDGFFLYDLQQAFYLPASAGAAADRLPSDIYAAIPPGKAPDASAPPANDPRFIPGAELPTTSSDRNGGGTSAVRRDGAAVIRNSDCPNAMSERDFQGFYEDALSQTGAEDRVGWLLEKLDDRCLSTDQVRLLARSLEGDAARYTFLRRAYARTADQGRFSMLESMLSSAEYRNQFRTLVGL